MSATRRAGQRAAAKPHTEPRGQKAHPAKPASKIEPGPEVSRRLEKSPAAFRTISEVADELAVPQHVLRFWESKFPQVRPLKRGGGRRYYRPEDVDLLGRIRQLLYKDGYTIKGVQRLMREGALKSKREAHHDAHAEPELPIEGPDAEAAEVAGIGPLDAAARDQLQALLAELLALKADLRRLAG